MSDLKEYTVEEVAKHNKPEDLWVIIDDHVYDLTEFQEIHPGGKKILARQAGKDASKQFKRYHDKERVMKKFGEKRRIGKVKKVESNQTSALLKNDTSSSIVNKPYGDMVPYGDAAWYQGYRSPYYGETHVALRNEVRGWVEENVSPYVDEWDQTGEIDPTLYKRFADQGYLPALVGLKKFPTEYTDKRIKSVPAEKVDPFHELIITEEVSRAGSGAVVWNLMGGFSIGIPPIFKYANESLKKRILPQILSGDKRICLCITSAEAGSDVANLDATAELTSDGKHYIVNGTKKWITNGVYSDYFTVAVRTGGDGMKGISMILIEREMGGVTTRKMETQGMRGSGSTFIEFDDVKVPVENLLGKENDGFKVIMTNFNHERLGTIIQAVRFARLATEEAMKHAHVRETFGVKLIEHGVIRNKLGQMVGRVEAAHNWLESLLYQYKNMSEEESMMRLGGPIAACKAFSTQAMEFCASEAVQVFGGLGYTRGGKGGVVERIFRECKAYSIPGGSLEIMLDLGIRQQIRVNKKLGAKL